MPSRRTHRHRLGARSAVCPAAITPRSAPRKGNGQTRRGPADRRPGERASTPPALPVRETPSYRPAQPQPRAPTPSSFTCSTAAAPTRPTWSSAYALWQMTTSAVPRSAAETSTGRSAQYYGDITTGFFVDRRQRG